MFIEVLTDRSVDEAGRALEKAAEKRKFGLIHMHDMQETLRQEGVTIEEKVFIYEFCHHHTARAALNTNLRLVNMLPFRVCIFREGGKTVVSTIRPTHLLSMFKEPTLENLYEEFEQILGEILREVA